MNRFIHMNFFKPHPGRWIFRRELFMAVGLGAGGQAVAGTTVTPIELRDLPLLFADDSGVAASSGIVRTLHPARTRPAPVLEADRPWEGSRVYVYGSVLRDPATGEFRLWYLGRTGRSDKPDRTPTLRSNGYDLTLYATSRDGVVWTKPALGLHAFEGSTANNIIFDLHSPSVLFDPFERDPARRYKMIGCFRGNYHAATSPDGLHWTATPGDRGVITSSDTITLTQHPVTGEYLAYHKRPDPQGRTVWLARSRDFLNWTAPERVFAADEFDNTWTSAPGQRTDIYNMSVFPHAAGFIGLPAVFRIMRIRTKSEIGPEQSPHDGPLDIQLATSPDGRTWRRSTPRLAIIPRGAPGTFDGGAMLGVTSTAVSTDRETWVYYTAINTGHGAPLPPKRLTIGRAEWRRHGFVSLDAGPDGGRIETRLLAVRSGVLIVNADARRGVLRMALLGDDDRPLPGYGLGDFEPAKTDATRAVARWRGKERVPTDRPFRVAIEMTNCRLYSLGANGPADADPYASVSK